jgi:hypothetical protein
MWMYIYSNIRPILVMVFPFFLSSCYFICVAERPRWKEYANELDNGL